VHTVATAFASQPARKFWDAVACDSCTALVLDIVVLLGSAASSPRPSAPGVGLRAAARFLSLASRCSLS
jgi:hypothetical protein